MSAGRIFVIGDIHGCAVELDRLLDAIAPGPADTVCFLGDYIDRGPRSRQVVDRVIRLRSEGPHCVYLKGNHEDMFMSYLGLGGLAGETFLERGGEPTVASYRIEALRGSAAVERIPPGHIEFFQSLQTHVAFGEFLCVHAGVCPSRPLDDQIEEDLFWIREEFIAHPHDFPYIVLFGHTPQREVLLDLPFKVGLDTGLVYGNRLSCLELNHKSLFQIGRDSKTVERTSLKRQIGDRSVANAPTHPALRATPAPAL